MKRFVLLFLLMLLGAACFFYWAGLQPVGKSEEKRFVINRGESTRAIAQRLENQGLIKSKYAFLVFLRLTNQHGKLQAGSFRLSPRYSVAEVIKVLQSGEVDTWVAFLEGWRKEQFAQELEKEMGLSASDFLQLPQVQEGYLFPDSYLFPTDYPVEKAANKMTDTFDQKWEDLDLSPTDLNQNEIVTFASLVEREADTDESRKIIAGILIKRWRKGWSLQVDATVQYLKASAQCSIGDDQCNWWPKVSKQDLDNFDSRYNTYKYEGLPPTPICNPSLDAIQAVINPRETDYWYYLTGKDGKMYYSQSLEEHNQKVQRYLGT